MRKALTEWGRARWPASRIIHEIVLGERRIDMLFVRESDLIGIEVKSIRDTITGQHMRGQLREFSFYIPEVWLAVPPKFENHGSVEYFNNLLIVDDDGTVRCKMFMKEPTRDELSCSRILERLWAGEAREIAVRRGLLQSQRARKMREGQIKAVLARMMTGHEIMAEVCRALRARPLHMTGLMSDDPLGMKEPHKPMNYPSLFDGR